MNNHPKNSPLTANDIAGLILAGGKSTRMGGQNKALLTLEGTTLLEHCYNAIAHQLQLTLISCGNHRYSHPNAIQIADNGEQGPLAGILAGLRWLRDNSQYQWLLSSPCDTPNLCQQWIPAMIKGLNTTCQQAPVYARHNQRDHFAHALWPVFAIPTIERALEQHQYSIHRVLQKLNATPVDLSTTCPANSFFNINSLADLTTVQQNLACIASKRQPK